MNGRGPQAQRSGRDERSEGREGVYSEHLYARGPSRRALARRGWDSRSHRRRLWDVPDGQPEAQKKRRARLPALRFCHYMGLSPVLRRLWLSPINCDPWRSPVNYYLRPPGPPPIGIPIPGPPIGIPPPRIPRPPPIGPPIIPPRPRPIEPKLNERESIT